MHLAKKRFIFPSRSIKRISEIAFRTNCGKQMRKADMQLLKLLHIGFNILTDNLRTDHPTTTP